MKRIVAALLASVLAAPLAAAAAEPAAQLFAQRCAVCHGKDGKGSPVGQKLGAKDLTAVKLSEPEIAKTIADGRGKMTPFKGKLQPAEIDELAKYVRGGLK